MRFHVRTTLVLLVVPLTTFLLLLISKVGTPSPKSLAQYSDTILQRYHDFKRGPDAKGRINVVLAANQKVLHVLPTVIHSIWNTTQRPVRLFIIYTQTNDSDPAAYLSCFMADLFNKDVHIISVNASQYFHPEVTAHMNRHGVYVRKCTESNYIRFYFHRILPKEVERIIYMDVDVLVMDDLGKLWDLTAKNEGILSGSWFDHVHADVVKNYRNTQYSSITWGQERLDGLKVNTTFYGINAGIFVMNLRKLRSMEGTIMKRLQVWAKGDTRYRWFPYDTQVLMDYVFYGELSGFPLRWNIGAIAFRGSLFPAIGKPGILHYYGGVKPWMEAYVEHKDLWKKYQVRECSGHGKCYKGEKRFQMFSCRCQVGFMGRRCEYHS